MKKYEAMFIVKPDLTEEQRKTLFSQIDEAINKNEGQIISSGVWSEKRKLFFPIKKCLEAVYYLVNFNINPLLVSKIKNTYRLNENILRMMITVVEEVK